MGFPRQEYWRGLPFPSPRYFPDSGIKLTFPALQADSFPLIQPGKSRLTGLLLLFNCSVGSSSVSPHAQTAAHQASLSFTTSQSSLKLMSIKSVTPSKHLVLFIPFSICLQSFAASGSFHMSQFFTSGGHSIGVSASASVFPIRTDFL